LRYSAAIQLLQLVYHLDRGESGLEACMCQLNASQPFIIGNVIAVCINFLTVGAYTYFLYGKKQARAAGAG
jgi:hypothetical protein